MNIKDIKIRKLYSKDRLRALVSISDEDMAIHDIKVIEGPERLFVAMPSRRDDNGIFRDIVHPITSEARQALEEKILKAYREKLEILKIPEIKVENAIIHEPVDCTEGCVNKPLIGEKDGD